MGIATEPKPQNARWCPVSKILADLRCEQAGCGELGNKKYMGFCLLHFKSQQYAEEKNKVAKIRKHSLEAFTPEEISYLARIDLQEVYNISDQIDNEIDPLLLSPLLSRGEILSNRIIKQYYLNINDLSVIKLTARDEKVKLAAITQIQRENEMLVKNLQALGTLAKAPDRIEIDNISAENILSKNTEGRIYDPEDITVRQVFRPELEHLIKKASQIGG